MIGLACYGLDPWVLPFTLRLKHEWLAHEYSSSCAGLGTGDLNPLQSIQRDFEIQPRKKKNKYYKLWLLHVCMLLVAFCLCVFFFYFFIPHNLFWDHGHRNYNHPLNVLTAESRRQQMQRWPPWAAGSSPGHWPHSRKTLTGNSSDSAERTSQYRLWHWSHTHNRSELYLPKHVRIKE